MNREIAMIPPSSRPTWAALCSVLTLAFLCATACSSGPEVKRALAIGDADAVAVSFWSGATGTRLVLRNPGAAVQASASNTRTQATSVRDLDSSQMQKLLDALATYEFFQLAAVPQTGRSKTSLTVDINGRQYVATGAQPTAEHLQRWTDCIAIVQDVYNRTSSFEIKELDAAERRRLFDEFERHRDETKKGPTLQKPEKGN